MGDDQLSLTIDQPVSTIAELYDEVDSVIAAAFPKSRNLWVHGEIQKISESGGHAYIDIVDPENAGTRQAPTLKVKCWNRTWNSLKRDLAGQGLYLEAGMTVTIRGSLDFYRARAEIGFILAEVDVTALLGKLALERAALIEELQREGLFDAQRGLPVTDVPRRVGLVGSPDTEGFNDFLGQLERSGFSFSVLVARSSVQGQNAPQEIASAVASFDQGDVDLICIVRGGGSKGDLVAFDSPEIARAIASCPIPIWTGIGHTGDESVADMVANQRSITPTACGAAVAARVATYFDSIASAAARIAEHALMICRSREQTYATVRGQLVGAARGHLRSYDLALTHTRRQLVSGPTAGLRRAEELLSFRSRRLVPLATSRVTTEQTTLMAKRRLLAAYDPVQTLKRGWSLTLDSGGKTIRSVQDAKPGTVISTRVADGTFESTIREKTEETT